jgi:hypothetical protein
VLQDPFERYRQIQSRAQGLVMPPVREDPFERYNRLSKATEGTSKPAPKEDPFERYNRLRSQSPSSDASQDEPSELEKLGAVALGVPAAINTVVSSTLGKLSRIPTLGQDNPVSRFFSEVEQGGREVFRPSNKRLSTAYESSETVGRVPAEIGKYMLAGGPFASAALGAGEAIGARPEESEAQFAAQIAGKMGSPRLQRALEQASQTSAGRALVSTVMSVVPDVLMQGGSKAVSKYRARGGTAAIEPPPVRVSEPSPVTPLQEPPRTPTPEAEVARTTVKLRDDALEPTTMPAATRRKQPLTQPQQVEGYFNYENFSADPRVQDRLKASASKFVSEIDTPLRVTTADKSQGLFPGKSVGDLINRESLDEVRKKVASDLGVNPTELVEKSIKGQRLDRYDLLRVRTAVNDVLAEEDALFKQLDSRSLSDDEVAKVNFRLSQLDQERNALLDTFTTQRTGTGRDMAALKITALRTADPVAWIARAQRLAQRPLTDAERVMIRNAADMKDLNELGRIANDLTKTTWRDKFNALYKSGLLSAPRTFGSNALGNIVMAGLESAKEYPATFFDTVLSAWTKTHTKSVGALDPRNMANVSFNGAKKGADDFIKIMRGERPVNLNTDLPREVKFETPFLNWYTRTVSRGLNATDAMFKNVAVSRSLDEQARVIAQAEKLTGEDFAKRVQELVVRPTEEMSMRAVADAEIATFQESSAIAEGVEKLAKMLGPAGDVLIPFRRTPANIAKRIYEYSPLGLASQLKRASNILIKRDATEQREFVNAFGRISAGSGAIALGYMMASEGRMTGFFPSNQRERDAWEEQGKLEGAIKVNEKSPWVQINKYSPLGNLFQIGAQMYNMDQDVGTTQGQKVFGALTAPLKSVSELPMVANVKDLTEAFQKAGTQESGEAALKVVGRSVSGALPFSGLLRSIAGGVDPLARETKSPKVLESIQNQVLNAIPFASRTLPAKVDPLGLQAERPFGVLGSMFVPSQVRDDLTQQDFVRKELERTGAVIGRVKRSSEETGKQYAEREVQVGTAIRNALAQVIANDPNYRQLGQMEPTRARLILDAYNRTLTPDKQIDVSKISNERIRSRLQGQYLEQQAERLRGQITRATSKGRQKLPRAVKSAMEAIVR